MALTGSVVRALAWGDCDPAGIIWYPTYYRWMDAASWDLLAAAGWPATRIREELVSMPLVRAACDFLSSPTFGDRIEIRSAVSRMGKASFELSHQFLKLSDDGSTTELARGTEARVWCRYSDGPGSPLRSTPIPDALRTALAPAQA